MSILKNYSIAYYLVLNISLVFMMNKYDSRHRGGLHHETAIILETVQRSLQKYTTPRQRDIVTDNLTDNKLAIRT